MPERVSRVMAEQYNQTHIIAEYHRQEGVEMLADPQKL
jgi:hypothetical protein